MIETYHAIISDDEKYYINYFLFYEDIEECDVDILDGEYLALIIDEIQE